ncbi:MAG: sugar transferase, partial [Bryobacteraceae bacterium]
MFFLLLLGLPMLLIMLVIRFTSHGPAIFSQLLCGLNGRRFNLYKFRSMVFDAEERKAALLEHNERTLVMARTGLCWFRASWCWLL